ncbi:MAG: tetratricopeptide repeat protein [Bacteroidota bacterium]
MLQRYLLRPIPILMLCAFTLASIPILGQSTSAAGSPLLDSLREGLQRVSNRLDSAKTYGDIATALRSQNPEVALLYNDTAWAIAQDTEDGPLLANTANTYCSILTALERNDEQLFWLRKMVELGHTYQLAKPRLDANVGFGVYYKRKGVYDSALHYYELAYQEAVLLGDTKNQVIIMGNRANVFKRLGKYDQAAEGYQTAIALADSIGKLDSKGINLMNLGNIYSFQGKILQSIECMEQALVIAEQVDHRVLKAYTLNNLGSLYTTQKDLPKAREYLKQGLAVAKQLNNRGMIFNNLREVGRISYLLDEDETAEENWDQAYALALEMGSTPRQANILVKLANVYAATGREPQAQKAYQDALAMLTEMNSSEHMVEAYSGLFWLKYNTGKYAQALAYAQTGMQWAEKIGEIQMLRNSSENLYTVHQALGNYQEALAYSVKFKTYSDSLINAEQIRDITTLENQFAYEKEKEATAAEAALREAGLQAEVVSQKSLRNLFLAGAGLLLISAIFLWVIYRNKRRAHQDQLQQNQIIKNLSQFKEAMTGMIAHDLKNPLSVIINHKAEQANTRHMAQQMLHLVNNILDVQKFEQTQVVLDKAPVPLERILHHAMEQVHPLLSVPNLQIQCTGTDGPSVLGDFQYLPRVFTNFLTNAIKFSPQNGIIQVTAQVEGDKVRLAIQDQGEGIPPEKLDHIFDAFGQAEARDVGGVKSTGLGLTFCNLALAAHGSQITVQSTVGEGTTFSFELPLAENVTQDEPESEVAPKDSVFSIPTEVLTQIRNYLPQLRDMPVYEAAEIESLLESIQVEASAEADAWIQEVIDAAYAGNQERYLTYLENIEATR